MAEPSGRMTLLRRIGAMSMLTVATMTWLGLEWARQGLELLRGSMDSGEGDADVEGEPSEEETAG